jgi:hypothetical protein
VLEAREERLDRMVALKLLGVGQEAGPNRTAQTLQEGRALSQLEMHCHPTLHFIDPLLGDCQ